MSTTGITPDHDQGRRNTDTNQQSPSDTINNRIRRAAGINVRPGQKTVPQIGDYD